MINWCLLLLSCTQCKRLMCQTQFNRYSTVVQKMKMFKCALCFAIISVLYHCPQALQCVDHNNNVVDWYVLNKLPQQSHGDPLVAQGAAYAYMTSNNADSWKLSSVSINDTNSIVGLTLQPLFTANSNILHILYNDELPDGSINFKKGHTKGLLIGDNDGGLWLVHSVPRFPDTDAGKYYYPHNGFIYGQSFLCISMDLENLDLVGTQLQYNLPNIFSRNMPSNLEPILPKLTDVMNNVTIKVAPWYHLQTLKSKDGLMFFSFGKSPKFAKELYGDWVAPTLNSSLLVETWPNEPGRIPSQCGPLYKIKNVKVVSIGTANCTFKTTTDHSKWAVATTDNPSSKWVCVGDINRSTPQRHRGGGTVCFSNGKVAEAYQKSAADIEQC